MVSAWPQGSASSSDVCSNYVQLLSESFALVIWFIVTLLAQSWVPAAMADNGEHGPGGTGSDHTPRLGAEDGWVIMTAAIGADILAHNPHGHRQFHEMYTAEYGAHALDPQPDSSSVAASSVSAAKGKVTAPPKMTSGVQGKTCAAPKKTAGTMHFAKHEQNWTDVRSTIERGAHVMHQRVMQDHVRAGCLQLSPETHEDVEGGSGLLLSGLDALRSPPPRKPESVSSADPTSDLADLEASSLQELRELVKAEGLAVKTNVGGKDKRTKSDIISDILQARAVALGRMRSDLEALSWQALRELVNAEGLAVRTNVGGNDGRTKSDIISDVLQARAGRVQRVLRVQHSECR